MDLVDLVNQLSKLEERKIVLVFTVLMYLVGFIVYCTLLYVPASYGRYTNVERYSMPAKLGWFVQELPAFLIPAGVMVMTQLGWLSPKYDRCQLAVLLCFTIHYFQRVFIYPFLIVGGKSSPVYVVSLAMLFCSVNGYMQARGAVLFSTYPDDKFTSLRVCFGLLIFWIGFVINLHSDHILRNLRKPGEKGYKIPHGGFFELVSSANYFGEIVEWLGFGVASWSIVGFAFSFFTAANLVPRAFSYHKWYQEKFEDYPKERKAVIPYLL